MNKKLKIALITTSIIAVGVSTFFAIKFYKLRKAYKSSITPEQLQQIINEKTKGLSNEFEEDDAIKNADLRFRESGSDTNSLNEPTSSIYDPNDPATWSDEDWTKYYAQSGSSQTTYDPNDPATWNDQQWADYYAQY